MKIVFRIIVPVCLAIPVMIQGRDEGIDIPSPGVVQKQNRSSIPNDMPRIPSPNPKRAIHTKKKYHKKKSAYRQSNTVTLTTELTEDFRKRYLKNDDAKEANTSQKRNNFFIKSRIYKFQNECALQYQHYIQNDERPYIILKSMCLGEHHIRLNRKDMKFARLLRSSQKNIPLKAQLKLVQFNETEKGFYWRWSIQAMEFENPFYQVLCENRKADDWAALVATPKDAELFSKIIFEFEKNWEGASESSKNGLLGQYKEIIASRSLIDFDQNCPLTYVDMKSNAAQNYVILQLKLGCLPARFQDVSINVSNDSDELNRLSAFKPGQSFFAELEFHRIIRVADKYYIYWNTILKTREPKSKITNDQLL